MSIPFFVFFLFCWLARVMGGRVEVKLKGGPSPELVKVSKCTTVASGILKTTTGHNVSLSSDVLTFDTNGMEVEFQSCQPNFGNFNGTNGSPVGGHLRVKSNGECLSLLSPLTNPPFAVVSAPCYDSDDSGQTFLNVVRQSDGRIYFVGNTQVNGSWTFFHSQCLSGYFGPSGIPTSGDVQLNCVKNVTGHAVGFTGLFERNSTQTLIR
ncbi:uncharacterized protein EI90DRAFT_3067407 [Cantharellus anzutake]|uniref:uncharacterized protein n=1 Tax=Cantharellus anzutake TaxID=1750568 RepID=UPI00190428C8|nr:uncharacterized protein EI90DRAFT_3067407 [Cantharellus anzutake]KAF8327606.1 hypothetical protein EI90DRAFT_3067407 [Cantharellus anzutake]